MAEALITAATQSGPTPARLAAAAALARRQDEAAMLDRYRDLLRTLPGMASAA